MCRRASRLVAKLCSCRCMRLLATDGMAHEFTVYGRHCIGTEHHLLHRRGRKGNHRTSGRKQRLRQITSPYVTNPSVHCHRQQHAPERWGEVDGRLSLHQMGVASGDSCIGQGNEKFRVASACLKLNASYYVMGRAPRVEVERGFVFTTSLIFAAKGFVSSVTTYRILALNKAQKLT